MSPFFRHPCIDQPMFNPASCKRFTLLYIYLNRQLPDVASLRSVKLPVPMRRQFIEEFGKRRGRLIPLKAFLATGSTTALICKPLSEQRLSL
uniref:Uncharacterized protein n=1 Tax=Utricularia reniformis TaxID=192314 RepID=A0A1Y0B0J5_9LAMI|nr:hypothetical protein AEK19_MT0645 [Utricularia reniformis]ART30898.1 hypothetical protein AEK19_MT0645 [Utricularia reniformis]